MHECIQCILKSFFFINLWQYLLKTKISSSILTEAIKSAEYYVRLPLATNNLHVNFVPCNMVIHQLTNDLVIVAGDDLDLCPNNENYQ